MEILGGVSAGEHLIGNGAILLKPLVVQALLQAKDSASTGAADKP